MPPNRPDSSTNTFAAGHPISNLYGMILENIDRAVIAFDSGGIITLFNPAAEALMECSSRQVVGKSYRDLFRDQETLLYLVKVALEEGRSITR